MRQEMSRQIVEQQHQSSAPGVETVWERQLIRISALAMGAAKRRQTVLFSLAQHC
jgi:hypothetical protein